MSDETRFSNTVLVFRRGMQSYTVFVHVPTELPPFERGLYAADELARWGKTGFTGQVAFLPEHIGIQPELGVAYLPCYVFFDELGYEPEDFSWTKP